MAQSNFIYLVKRQVFPTTNGFFVKAVNKFEGYSMKCRRVAIKMIVHTSLIFVSYKLVTPYKFIGLVTVNFLDVLISMACFSGGNIDTAPDVFPSRANHCTTLPGLASVW